MISYTQLQSIVNNNGHLSADGRLILENALRSKKFFSIVPPIDGAAFTEINKHVVLVPLSLTDYAAITEPSPLLRDFELSEREKGYECLSCMNVYPDSEFEKIPEGVRTKQVGYSQPLYTMRRRTTRTAHD